MNNPSGSTQPIDITFFIRLSCLALLMIWSYEVIRPFLVIFTGGAIIAIGLFPTFEKLTARFKIKWLIAFLLLMPFLGLLILPGWYLSTSVIEGVNALIDRVKQGQFLIPPPESITTHWPSYLNPLLEVWHKASHNLNEFYINYKDPLNQTGKWIFLTMSDMGMGIIQLLASIILAWFMLVYSSSFSKPATLLLTKTVGSNGTHYQELIVLTVRNVMTGVLGVAILQAVMCGIAFYTLDLPFAGILTMICLILAISQIGMWPVFAIAVVYSILFLHGWVAFVFIGWMLITSLTEQIIKPLLLGRNSPVPMFVLFIGSIGGLISMGITGLFLGPVVFTLVWQMVLDWLSMPTYE